ncbi:hypothetical protein ALC57_03090 [Trachymyrmex cornetzi]|uniref:BED-type domain-containing protein n=1 Tax=Trachymyrmex cornetzi TaxID=471704 RepID=A0A151JMH4_9HYME|nr:hypothetical protein ALC57_03090 [Trachymyrmex cornetzi]
MDLKRRRTSIIWNFFTVKNELYATCNFCKQNLSYKSFITNLKQHIKNKHPSIKLEKSVVSASRDYNTDDSDELDKPTTSASSGSVSSVAPKYCDEYQSLSDKNYDQLDQQQPDLPDTSNATENPPASTNFLEAKKENTYQTTLSIVKKK